MKMEHSLTPCTKMALRFKHKTRHHQIPIKEHRQNIPDINLTNVFLGQSPKATEIEAKVDQWNLIKLTSFCTAKETILKKTTYRMGEDSFEMRELTRVLSLKYTNNLYNSTTKTQQPDWKIGKRME